MDCLIIKNDKSNCTLLYTMEKDYFKFKYVGSNSYLVTYTYPKSKKSISRLITDVNLVNLTRNEEHPKKIHLLRLKQLVRG